MKRVVFFLVLFLSILIATSCQTTGDATKDGYWRWSEAKTKKDIAESKTLLARLNEEKFELDKKAKKLQKEKGKLDERYRKAASSNKMTQEKKLIKQMQNDISKMQSKISQANREIDALKGGDIGNSHLIEQKKREIELLNTEIDDLLAIISAM
jgi:chromosome segregation ATPase